MADLTLNEKVVMTFIMGYYAGTGEMPDTAEIATGLRVNNSVVRYIIPRLYRKGRLSLEGEKYVISKTPTQHRIHSDDLPKSTKAIIFT